MFVEFGFYCSFDSVFLKKYNDGVFNIKIDEYFMEEGVWGNFFWGVVLVF